MLAGVISGLTKLTNPCMMWGEVERMTCNLYEAKTQLSQLVERAAAGEEVVIAKAGKPMVKMVPVEPEKKSEKRQSGQNLLRVTYIADDFDAPMADEELELWGC